MNVATLPLVMATKGENERALVEFLLDNHEQYASYIGYLIELHGKMLMEVLMMRQMNPEEIGLEMETVMGLLRLYNDDEVMDGMGKLYGDEQVWKELTRKMGEERAMKELAQMIGEERTVEGLAQMMGEERLRQMVERLSPQKSDNNDD